MHLDSGDATLKRRLGARDVQYMLAEGLQYMKMKGNETFKVAVKTLEDHPDLTVPVIQFEKDGAEVLALERLRYADGAPLAVMRNWLPLGLVELDAERLERAGLYQLMRAAGVGLHLASQTIGARGASPAEAKLLRAHRGEPLLTMKRTAYNESGQPVELADHIYRASLYSFEIVLVTR